MKHDQCIIHFFSILIISLLLISQQVRAETRVSGEQLKTLLSGNTIEGKYIKWKTSHKMYFEATGNIRRIDSLNNKESGNWFISDLDNLCINIRKNRCNEVMKRSDGGYNVYRKDKLRFTIEKIVQGNPYNL